MFLKKSLVKGNLYYTIVESYREGTKIKQRSVRQLGKLTEDEVKRWEIILYAQPHEVSKFIFDPDDIVCTKSYRHGTIALAHGMWRKLGIDDIISLTPVFRE
ncbi:MAG: hypothetical protein ACP5RS_04100 [Thermoplasmata archaeon]